jgi:hypothetical protein
MSESQYLEFRSLEDKPKTKVWEVVSKTSGDRLGVIKFFGRWRQYTFFPEKETAWNNQCLLDVSGFLKEQNYARQGITVKPTLPKSTEDWLLRECIGTRFKAEKMPDDKLLEYIKGRTYRCCCCADLRKLVLENGLEAIDKYDGMICGGVEDMFIRRGRY